MKTKVDQIYPPLLLLNRIAAQYPDCWALVEKLRRHDDANESGAVVLYTDKWHVSNHRNVQF